MPVLLTAALLAGCLSPGAAPQETSPTVVADTAHSGQGVQRTWTLAAYDSRELNLHMTVGNEITYSLTMSSPLAWDLHSHTGTSVTTHAKGEGDAHGMFTAPAEGTYSFFVVSQSAGANVTLDVTGGSEELTA